MENNRGQSIFLSVVGIATLLVAIVGATFAYFSITVSGNENASNITVTTAKVGGVTYTDGSALIQVDNAYPGYTKSKTFTVASDANVDTNSEIDYQIILKTSNPALSSAANANTRHEFVYNLTGEKTGNGTVANAVYGADMPTTGTAGTPSETNIGSGTLKGTETHTYTFTVLLRETGTEQDDLQGLTYEGIIQIVVATNEGMRTWDGVSGWKQYTANDNTPVPTAPQP